MPHTGDIGHIPAELTWKDRLGLTTQELGKLVGNRRLYVNLDTVPQGANSTRYHSHSTQEEFFYILSGSGTLRLNGEVRTVTAGDFLGKPAGEGIAHTFYNPNAEPLRILDIGTVDAEDTCFYPDDGVYLHKQNGECHAYRADGLLVGWSPEPNP